ncbi:MAG: glycosyltransferase, partial [Bacteroidota bacterium]
AEKILSLDTDLLILLDILELNDFQYEDHAVMAYNTGEAQSTRDALFYCDHLQLPPQTSIFNTGVILFNSSLWKSQKITKLYQEIGEKYPAHLLCADQTLLNAALCGKFGHLPPKYNFRWFPTDMVSDNQQAVIFHFVGSPKPWDVFGKKIHPAYTSWQHYHPTFWTKKYSAITYQKIYRTWKIKKSIARCLINQLKSGINASTNYYPSNL